MATRSVFVVFAVAALVSAACAPDGPDAGSARTDASTSAPEFADDPLTTTNGGVDSEPVATDNGASTVAESDPVSTDPAIPESPELDGVSRELPTGPLYLPAGLPNGWTIRTVTTFPEPDVAQDEALRSASFVAHPSEGGFAAGGALVTVTEYADDGVAAEAASIGQLGVEPTRVSVAGFGDAYVEEEPEVFSTLSASQGRIVVQLTGSSGLEDLVAIAESLRVGLANAGSAAAVSTVELDLPGWELEMGGTRGSTYELGIDTQGGTVSVLVNTGESRASLYLSGDDYEAILLGDVGEGYFAIQRIETKNLEFPPRIVWWVPDVLLSGFPTTDPALVVTALDSFIEVDEETFAAATTDASFVAMELEFDPLTEDTRSPPPDAEPPTATPLDDAVLDKLLSFIEDFVGRSFENRPEVALIDRDALAGTVPPGTFVSQRQWDLFRALGLVPATADRLDADAVRAEQVRGVCCPVQMVEQENPAFNEVVIVHELTHGLDTELKTGAAGSNEPVDPIRAMVEGNAHRVAFAYGDTLEAAGAELPELPAVFNSTDSRLPHSIREVLEFPYDEGRVFSAALFERGGEQAIVDAFADPPTTSEQILDLDAYLADERGTSVERPEPPEGATPLSTGTIGAFALLLLLVSSVDGERADELALAWSGDGYTVYGDPTAPCVAATIEFDDGDSAEAVAAVLADQPLDSATNEVAVSRASVSLTRCADA